ncbi:MAG: hypothetical protein JKY56_19455 [Kofleriaceae bacterium]|nr:hypothetical protein [Kofleriaceae bacterium]
MLTTHQVAILSVLLLACGPFQKSVQHVPPVPKVAPLAASPVEEAPVSESVPALVDASESTPFSIYAIDVGQGDSTLIVGPRQEGGRRTALLIDAGDGGYFGKVRGQC